MGWMDFLRFLKGEPTPKLQESNSVTATAPLMGAADTGDEDGDPQFAEFNEEDEALPPLEGIELGTVDAIDLDDDEDARIGVRLCDPGKAEPILLVIDNGAVNWPLALSLDDARGLSHLLRRTIEFLDQLETLDV